VGEAEGEGLAPGEGLVLGNGVGDVCGDGEGERGTTWTETVWVAALVPLFAERVNAVDQRSWIVRLPFASTVPTPLSIETESAPATFQLSVVNEPVLTVEGLAEKLWIVRAEGPVSWEMRLHPGDNANNTTTASRPIRAGPRLRSISSPPDSIKTGD
jgi:hypothetical protein